MVEQKRIQTLLDQLNTQLDDITPYKLALVAPSDIQPVETNAHYMPKATYDRLVANIERDGNLASLPFCWRTTDGRYISLSGNHRVMAAIAANIPQILILYTDAQLSQSEQIAVQLSHNAIYGQDDPATLKSLWEQIIELELKEYSGLDEQDIARLKIPTVEQVNAPTLQFEEITLLFLPSEVERIDDVLARLGKSSKQYAAHVADFDSFFATLLKYKEAAAIQNTATAFVQIIAIVEQWLSDH